MSDWNIKATTCPHCGSVTVSVSFCRKTAWCWQGHKYPNVERKT